MKSHPSRRIDVASLLLAIIGFAFGAVSYWLIMSKGVNPLVVVPSVVAATIGVMHLVKREVRESKSTPEPERRD